MDLFSELKRRRVYRAGIAYLVTAWVLLQLADILGDNLDLPDWMFRGLFAGVVVGFPIVLILSWVFERTKDGLRVDRGPTESSPRGDAGSYLQPTIILVLMVIVGVLVVDRFRDDDASGEALARTVAVLPFSTQSAASDDAFFVEGMHDDILTQLAGLQTLERVISRTTIERYRETQLSIPEIAAELDVAAVLEGSVQRAGERVRINMKLYDAGRDAALWSKTWDKELTLNNLFSIQNAVTREVVAALDGVLSDREMSAMKRKPTNNFEAFELHAAGRQKVEWRNAPALAEALELFESAIEIDPNYAEAYVGVADALSLQPEYAGVDMQSTFAPRQEAIDKALALDSQIAPPYASLGLLRWHQGEIPAAEEALQRALEINPNYTNALHWYALLLRDSGRVEEAKRIMRRARDADPLAPILAGAEASMYILNGEYSEARAMLRRAIQATPDFYLYYELVGDSFFVQGNFAEAQRWFDEAVRLEPTAPDARIGQCETLLVMDDLELGKPCVDRLSEDFPNRMPVGQSPLHFQLMVMEDRLDEFLVPIGFALELGTPVKIGIAAAYVMSDDAASAKRLLETIEPDLFGSGPIPNLADYDSDIGLLASVVLNQMGQPERAAAVLEAAKLADYSKSAEFDAALAFLAQDKDEAAAASLDRALESGRFSRWWLLRAPVFSRDTISEAWDQSVAAVNAEIARQRESYRNRPELGLL
ncbi:MAG: tetratricopeptide repeat protein [Pseudomonadota bacterium]